MSSRREVLLGAAGVASLAPPARAAAPAGMRRFLAERMRAGQFPGMQVAVVRNGQLEILESFGLADLANPAPVTGSTVFQLASCTKAFVGVAIMQLEQAGKLRLDAPVSAYLDGLPAPWRPVTVGQLASHTSGLPDIVEDLGSMRLVAGDFAASWAKVQDLPMQSQPGTAFSYNQTNYLLLGRIITSVSGEPFDRFIRRRQFEPAGMTATTYGDDHDVVPHSARVYTPYLQVDGGAQRSDRLYNTYIAFPAELRTCGGVYSTALDVSRWLMALDRGDLLSKAALARLRTAWRFNDGKPSPWGIGGWVVDRPAHPTFMAVGAAKSAFAVYPQEGLGIVVLTNLSADMGLPFLDRVAGRYLPDLVQSQGS